jgi:hypothetical protein
MTTLVFLTTDKILSRLIRKLTHSAASHVALGLSVQGVPVLLQADVGGVQITPREKFMRHHQIVSEWAFTVDIEPALSRGVREIGERYDYVGLFGYLAVVLGRLFHRRIRNPLASRKAVVCSEFVVGLDPEGHAVPEWKGLDPEETLPADLLVICEQSAAFTKV